MERSTYHNWISASFLMTLYSVIMKFAEKAVNMRAIQNEDCSMQNS